MENFEKKWPKTVFKPFNLGQDCFWPKNGRNNLTQELKCFHFLVENLILYKIDTLKKIVMENFEKKWPKTVLDPFTWVKTVFGQKIGEII